MKLLFASVIFSIISLVIGDLPSEEIAKFVANTVELYEQAEIYQQKCSDLQNNINEYIVEVRTAISSVLTIYANETLERIETNADTIFEQELEARTKLFTHPNTTCILHLRDGINKITEFTGYESSNCVARYDLSLSRIINSEYDAIKDIESVQKFGDIIHIVIRSFVGLNVFTSPKNISDAFTSKFDEKNSSWLAFPKDINIFKETLSARINGTNNDLETCFMNLQAHVNPSYDILIKEIATCDEFDNTRDPYAIFLE
jgi:hypothetical protein